MSGAKPYGDYARALKSCEAARRRAAQPHEPLTLTKLSGAAPDPVLARAEEAFFSGLGALDYANVLDLPAGARRITDPHTRRDLSPLMQERMQEVCYYLTVTTPFGKRIVELISSYVVGEGFQIVAEDSNVQAVIDRFAGDPVNDLKGNLRAWTDESTIFGELCLPTAVNPVDGFVRLGYVDPMDILMVEFGRMATSARESSQAEIAFPVAVLLKPRIGEIEGRRLDIVRRDEKFDSETFGQLVGDCFYHAINKAKGASRGISELFNIADWLDVLDQIVFDGADRARFMNAWLWHFVVKGGDDAAVDKIKQAVLKRKLSQGGVQFTNDQVEIKALSPDLKGTEYAAILQNLKAYGLGGVGFPMHWFADPVDANRATAAEMGEPTIKKLTDRQGTMRLFLAGILEFVIDQAIAHGVLAQGVNRKFKVSTPDVSVKDLAKVVSTMHTGVTALTAMEEAGYIRSETAARGSHLLLTQIGIEVDSQKEFSLAQQEKQERDAAAIDQLNPQNQLADALKNLPPATEMQQ